MTKDCHSADKKGVDGVGTTADWMDVKLVGVRVVEKAAKLADSLAKKLDLLKADLMVLLTVDWTVLLLDSK